MSAEPKHDLRIALVGFGYAGKTFHQPLIDQVRGLRLTHLVSRTADATGRSGIRVSAVADEVFVDPNIDVVVIATPNDTHFDLARRALLAGKHVVVEKPFTTTVSEARELVLLSKGSRRLLSVFHNRRSLLMLGGSLYYLVAAVRLGRPVPRTNNSAWTAQTW